MAGKLVIPLAVVLAASVFVSRAWRGAEETPDGPRETVGTDARAAPPPIGALGPVRRQEGAAVEIVPYVLELSERAAALAWVTREARRGTIELVGPEGARTLTEEAAGRHHRVELDGLEPGTRYRYLVDGRFAGDLDTPRPGERRTFLVFGHPGGTQAAAAYPFEAVAARLSGLRPDFAICTGDLCYYTNEESFDELYFDVFAEYLSRRPIYVAPGNHEAGYPTSEGMSYDVFRALFPYRFPTGNHGYHAFVQGNIEFFAFAYAPLTRAEFEKQLVWLADALDASRSEFRIVLVGGAQDPAGFDRGRFFQTAAAHGADFVFGGDGSGAKVEKTGGLDFFFAGTNNRAPHEFFWVNADEYRLEVLRYDVTMSELLGSWAFETRRAKEAVVDARPRGAAGSADGSVEYADFSLPADRFHGVRIRVQNPLDKHAYLWLRWAPERERSRGGDRYFREQSRLLAPDSTSVHHFPLPRVNPRSGAPWVLDDLEVRIGGTALPAGFDAQEHLEEVSLFVDPLRAQPD